MSWCGSLSVEEKVGRIIQTDVGSVTAGGRAQAIGSDRCLNGGNSAPGGDDLAPARRYWLAAADAFFDASMDTRDGKHAIPIMWGVDAVAWPQQHRWRHVVPPAMSRSVRPAMLT